MITDRLQINAILCFIIQYQRVILLLDYSIHIHGGAQDGGIQFGLRVAGNSVYIAEEVPCKTSAVFRIALYHSILWLITTNGSIGFRRQFYKFRRHFQCTAQQTLFKITTVHISFDTTELFRRFFNSVLSVHPMASIFILGINPVMDLNVSGGYPAYCLIVSM